MKELLLLAAEDCTNYELSQARALLRVIGTVMDNYDFAENQKEDAEALQYTLITLDDLLFKAKERLESAINAVMRKNRGEKDEE